MDTDDTFENIIIGGLIVIIATVSISLWELGKWIIRSIV